jgi:predicted nucleotidyltransferase
MPFEHRDSGVPVDISFGALPFEHELVERAQPRSFGGIRLPMPSVEDLIILKAVAHRPKDIHDLRTIISVHPELDRRRIRSWVQQFADALEMPEIWDDLAPLLDR